ncbi:Transmembrane 9 superfamily member 1 [Camellia lanceoleosa]|uniref:Transmembrane 9 superfamily member 1 n=1 Tax=Camellia lanceoleosa TaxID=1840588 RepID=A0ACC0GCD3_9ERIC|nr:Transmembrane 9 superfamily member 1 [Camellia lanceoleosa]
MWIGKHEYGGLLVLCLLLGFGFQFSYIFVGALFFTISIFFFLVSASLNLVDDLPLWGFVGELHPDKNSDNKHVLYTHKNIIVKYNKDQIIHVNLTQESPKPLEVGRALDMT